MNHPDARQMVLVLMIASLIAGTILANVMSDNLAESLSQFANWVKARGAMGRAGFVLLMIIACTTSVIPASLIAMLSGGLFGVVGGTILSSLGLSIGALLAFVLSRYFLRSTFQSWVASHISLAELDRQLANKGWSAVGILRLSPVAPFAITSYAFGLSSVKLRDYIIGTSACIGPLPAYVYVGTLADETLRTMGGEISWPILALWLLGFVATVGAAIFFTRLIRKTSSSTRHHS